MISNAIFFLNRLFRIYIMLHPFNQKKWGGDIFSACSTGETSKSQDVELDFKILKQESGEEMEII